MNSWGLALASPALKSSRRSPNLSAPYRLKPTTAPGNLPRLPFLLAKPLITLSHAGFRAIAATEPDWSLANEVADYDPVVMPLADRDLVDADHRRPRSSRLGPQVPMLRQPHDHQIRATNAHDTVKLVAVA